MKSSFESYIHKNESILFVFLSVYANRINFDAKHVCFLICILLTSFVLPVQADVLTGRVLDKDTGEPLENVHIETSEYLDISVRVNQFVTDSLGYFKTTNMEGSKTLLKFYLLGYHRYRKELMLLGNKKDTLNIGDIHMRISDVLLRNLEVKARMRTFVIRGDTVVFNPKAFHLPEGTRLSELLTQLPGVTVSEGTLQWMGKPIRLLMDGKELFSNTSLFSQTIPAEAIEAIKAYDKGDDLENRVGKKDATEDYVFDLNVKPSFLERWYGEAKASYETKDMYLLRGDATLLSSHNPMFVTVNVGNNNNFIRSRSYGSISSGGGGGFGKQQMGATGFKHQWNHKQGEKELENYITADVFVAHNDHKNTTLFSTEEFIVGTPRTFNLNKSKWLDHELLPKLNFHANFQIDTLTRISFRANGEWKKQRSKHYTHEGLFHDNPYHYFKHPLDALFRHPDSLVLIPVTTLRSFSEELTESEGWTSRLSISLSKQLPKNGALDVDAFYDFNEQKQTLHYERMLDYFQNHQNDKLEFRKGNKPTTVHDFGLNALFRQWWGNHVLFMARYGSDYRYSRDQRTLYDLHLLPHYDPSQPLPEELLAAVLNKENSYLDNNNKFTQNLELSTEIESGRWRFSPTLKLQRLYESSDYERGRLDTLASRTKWIFVPSLNMRYAPLKTSVWEASYSYESYLPSLLSTLNFVDDTNPLYITEGNPDLRRVMTHNASLGYRANLNKHQQTISLSLDYSKKLHPITSLTRFNTQTGVYRTKSVHVHSGDRLAFRSNYTQAFKEYWEFTNRLSFSYSRDYNYLLQTEEMSSPILNRRNSCRLEESPRFSYRGDAVKVSIGGHIAIDYYDNDAFESVTERTINYGADVSAEYRWRSFTLGTDFRMRGYDGFVVSELNRIIPLWNVYGQYKFLRNKATLEIGFSDILNKDKGYTGHVTPVSRIERYSDMHHHYFWTTFSYRFGAKK